MSNGKNVKYLLNAAKQKVLILELGYRALK